MVHSVCQLVGQTQEFSKRIILVGHERQLVNNYAVQVEQVWWQAISVG